jgi:hypothetical protein
MGSTWYPRQPDCAGRPPTPAGLGLARAGRDATLALSAAIAFALPVSAPARYHEATAKSILRRSTMVMSNPRDTSRFADSRPTQTANS